MSIAQFIDNIYLTISESIARFGRLFCVELLRFNTCGFPALLRIREDGAPPETEIQVAGHLPPQLNITKLYDNWKSAYDKGLGVRGHPSFKTESSVTDLPCCKLAEDFADSLKTWLNSGDREWQQIRDGLQQNLRRDDDIRAMIQTEDPQLRLLPWHLWDLFAQYNNKAEIALSSPQYTPSGTKTPSGNRVRILAILGDKKGTDSQTEINPQADLDLLKLHLRDAEIVPLVEPQLEDFRRYIWDDRGWHILFFAGAK